MTRDDSAGRDLTVAPENADRERQWDRTTAGHPTAAIVEAVARAEGCDPTALPPLFEAVDPTALEALFPADPRRNADRVSFRYHGYAVDVRPSVVRIRSLES